MADAEDRKPAWGQLARRALVGALAGLARPQQADRAAEQLPELLMQVGAAALERTAGIRLEFEEAPDSQSEDAD